MTNWSDIITPESCSSISTLPHCTSATPFGMMFISSSLEHTAPFNLFTPWDGCLTTLEASTMQEAQVLADQKYLALLTSEVKRLSSPASEDTMEWLGNRYVASRVTSAFLCHGCAFNTNTRCPTLRQFGGSPGCTPNSRDDSRQIIWVLESPSP